jgi:hypothetical protein
VGAKNGAMALPASLLLNETKTVVPSSSSAQLYFSLPGCFNSFFWSVEQLLVLLWLGCEQTRTVSIILSATEMQYHHGAL